jgi:hypothetical protein
MKKFSTSVAKRATHIKTTRKSHLTSVRMAIVKKAKSDKSCENVEKKEHKHTVGGKVS